MEVVIALTAVLAAAAAVASNVRPTSMAKCTGEFLDVRVNCSFAYHNQENGLPMCCNRTSWLYKKDFSCLCYNHRGTSGEEIQLVLAGCGINTGGSFSCSAKLATSSKTFRRPWNHPRVLLSLPSADSGITPFPPPDSSPPPTPVFLSPPIEPSPPVPETNSPPDFVPPPTSDFLSPPVDPYPPPDYFPPPTSDFPPPPVEASTPVPEPNPPDFFPPPPSVFPPSPVEPSPSPPVSEPNPPSDFFPPPPSVSPSPPVESGPPVPEPNPPDSNPPPISIFQSPPVESSPPVPETIPPPDSSPPPTPIFQSPPFEPSPPVPETNPPPDSSAPPTSVFLSPPVEPSPPVPKPKPPPASLPPPTLVLGPNTPLPISTHPPPPRSNPVPRWPPPITTPDSPHSTTTPLIVGVVSGSAATVILVLGILFVLWKRRSRTMRPHDQPPKPGETHQDVLQSMDHSVNLPAFRQAHGPGPNAGASSTCTFTYEELSSATNGFSTYNILGEGGFGSVYKGVLPNGTDIAVKLLKPGSWQGEHEFQTEVEIISRVHHKHLISLIGYCNEGNEKILVYAFLPNKTLEFHLHGNGQLVMEWFTRMKIAIGSAKGLAYLHEDCYPTIVHRDVKAANILLDFNFEPKVADFGLAKFICDNITHVSTRVVGTFGYLSPEYAATGKLTEKSDVFSFGVILLELITGRRPVDQTSPLVKDGLVEWAMPLLSRAHNDGNYYGLVDERLERNYDPFEMSRMIACAVTCLSRFAQSRPRMSQVVRMLEGEMSLEDRNYRLLGSTDHLNEQNRVESSNFSNPASADSERTRWTTSSNFTPRTGEYHRNTPASSWEFRSVVGR